MEKERIEWIDIAKGIGIGCVVMGHIFSPQMLANKIIFLFHIPLFFYISGFLYKKASRNGAYTVKKLRNLIVPYFSVFALVYPILFFAYFPEGYTLNQVGNNILYYVLGGRHLREFANFIFVAMWFISCLFLVQVIYNYIQTTFKQRTVHIIVGGMLMASYINSIYFPDFWLYWCANVTLAAIPIYHIGHLSRQIGLDKCLYKYSLWLIPAGCISALSLVFFPLNRYDMMLNYYGIPLITLICSILCILMIRSISVYITRSNILTRIFSEFGKASLVIMAFHLPVYQLLWKYFEISSIPAIVVITILPYFIYHIFNKFKITQVLFLGKYSKEEK
ncbi:MAG: acyltransferase family protein [Prevotella sp.]|jgi:fucose 4-O-acetylase-like acetyltransferase|nr:acyltransferase family protein [Prevotella sp.]